MRATEGPIGRRVRLACSCVGTRSSSAGGRPSFLIAHGDQCRDPHRDAWLHEADPDEELTLL